MAARGRPRHSLEWVRLATIVVAALAALLASSPGRELELSWDAPSQCPQQAAVREAIDSNLGREAFDAALSSVLARGTITADADQWRLDIEVSWPAGRVQRTVVSRECAELADAAGLIVAVALDLLRVENAGEPLPSLIRPSQAPQANEEERPVLAARREPAPNERVRSVAIDARLGGVLEIGSLALVRGGFAIGLGFVGARWRVDIVGHYLAPRAVRRFATAPDAGVAVQQSGGGVRACLLARVGPVELPSCVGVEAGVAAARGIGLDDPQGAVLPWAAVVVGQELTWVSRHRIGVFVGVDAMLHVVRPRFRVMDLGVAASTGWVGARVSAGPLVRF